MILKIFTVYDSKAQCYMPPFFERASGIAIRQFEASVQAQDHQFNRHAEDYTLFEVGTYDDNTCEIEMHPHKISLGNGIEFRHPELELDSPKLNLVNEHG